MVILSKTLHHTEYSFNHITIWKNKVFINVAYFVTDNPFLACQNLLCGKLPLLLQVFLVLVLVVIDETRNFFAAFFSDEVMADDIPSWILQTADSKMGEWKMVASLLT